MTIYFHFMLCTTNYDDTDHDSNAQDYTDISDETTDRADITHQL